MTNAAALYGSSQAHITVFHDAIVTFSGASKDDVMLYGALACNPDNKEDPIDTAVLAAFRDHFGETQADALWDRYERVAFHPFDAVIKRSVVELRDRETGRRVRMCKGLVVKVLKTGNDEASCGEWEVEDYGKLKGLVAATDAELGKCLTRCVMPGIMCCWLTSMSGHHGFQARVATRRWVWPLLRRVGR